MWHYNLIDADNALRTVFSYCLETNNCPLNASSPEEAIEQLQELYEKLRKRPMPVFKRDGASNSYGVVNIHTVKNAILNLVLAPYSQAPNITKALASLINDNDPNPLWDAVYVNPPSGNGGTDASSLCNTDTSSEFKAGSEAHIAIACNDAHVVPNTWEDTKDGVEKLKSVTPKSQIGGLWGVERVECQGWPRENGGEDEFFRGMRAFLQAVFPSSCQTYVG